MPFSCAVPTPPRPRALLALVVLVGAILLTPPAARAQRWSAPDTLTSGHVVNVLTDARGTTTAAVSGREELSLAQAPAGRAFGPLRRWPDAGSGAWQQTAVDGHGRVHAAWRSQDGIRAGVVAPQSEGIATLAPFNTRQRPRVAASERGDVAVAWREFHRPEYAIYVAVRPAGGEFGRPQLIVRDRILRNDPHVAVTPSGDVVVVYAHSGDAAYAARGRTAFGPPARISEHGRRVGLQGVTADAAGGITAVWTFSGDQGVGVAATYAPPGGPFGEPVTVTPGGDHAAVAAASDGALVAWREGAAVRLADLRAGTVAAAHELGTGNADPARGWYGGVAAGVATDGGTVAAWVSVDGRLVARFRPPGGAFGPVETIVSEEAVRNLRASAGPGERATVLWAAPGAPTTGDRVRYARRAPEGQSPVGGSPPGGGQGMPPPRGDDRRAPRLFVRAAARQRLSRRRRFALAISADKPSRIRVTAVVRAGRARRALRPARRFLRARRTVTVRLRTPARAAALVRRAVRAGRSARVAVVVTARDAAGHVTRMPLTVRVR